MNRTGKPIDVDKYPLVQMTSDLCLELDKLPASMYQTNLIMIAVNLLTEIWNYYEIDTKESGKK